MLNGLDRLITRYDEPERVFWHQVLDTLHDVVVLVSPERKILYINDKARDLCGLSDDEARGAVCTKAIDCPNCACDCLLFKQGEIRDLTVAVYDKDGQRRRMLKNATVLRDEKGAIIGGLETLKDITDEENERSEKEKQVDELFMEKKKTEALLDNLCEGVFSIRHDYTVLSCSRRLADITGYDRHDVVGADFRSLYGLDGTHGLPDDARSLAEQPLQLLLRTRNGALRRVELRFEPFRFSDDEILGVMRSLDADDCGGATEFHDFHGLVSVSHRMMEVFRLVEKAAATDASVLLLGETGTGKELVARAIHRLSERRNQPFKAINCATLRGDLLFSCLFGHDKGAFTGAAARKIGKFEHVAEGTLLLDEIHEIPVEYQAILLRVLEERWFERVGGNQHIPFGARVVCATNVGLGARVERGEFRRDLFYRLNVIPIELPPLRERREDVGILLQYFSADLARRNGHARPRMRPELVRALEAYDWPGNIRELKNLVEYLTYVADGPIGVSDLPPSMGGVRDAGAGRSEPVLAAEAPGRGSGEEARIRDVLRRCRYNKRRAAEELGINRTTLWRKMKRLGMSP